jgi:hypothetical protein
MKAMTRTWLFLGLTALAIPFAGCGGGGGGGGGGPACADLRFATVAWSIEDQFGNPVSCQAAGARDVILNFGSASYSFDCRAQTGATPSGLPPGNYEFSMQLLAPDGTVLSDTTVGNPPVAYPIYSCAQDDIPDVTFGIL